MSAQSGRKALSNQRCGTSHEQVMRAIELFGTKVLPEIRDV